ncbi:MAG: alpha/beta hydrolase-fold protein [Byssovorax sp.]
MRAYLLSIPLLLAGCSLPMPPPPPAPPSLPAVLLAPPPCEKKPEAPGRITFRVTRAPDPSGAPMSGRLLVFMSSDKERQPVLGPGFGTLDPAFAAADVDALAPGQTIDLDPDKMAFPRPFSELPAGDYQIMAVLDPDHGFPHTLQVDNDLYGPVEQVTIDPAHAGTIALRLDQKSTHGPLIPPEGVVPVALPSLKLSAFFGRPVQIEAFVLLPKTADQKKRFPTAYLIPGFGSSDESRLRRAKILREAMDKPPFSDIALVYLKGEVPTGHHVFADSPGTGPWGAALVEELIPMLEKLFPLIARPEARFLTGHSSGGWSSLWLQINHPDFFGGTWSTSPDPVDFHALFGTDVSPGATDNFYRDHDGKPKSGWRDGPKTLFTFEQLIRYEDVLGRDGGPFSTLEWVFSPRGPHGKPLPLFDRRTGVPDPEVQKAWARWDIHHVLESRWRELGPRLKGKLHVWAGAEDNFHLEEGVKRLCAFLKEKGSDATCEIVPGKDHFNLYGQSYTAEDGLLVRILRDMLAKKR